MDPRPVSSLAARLTAAMLAVVGPGLVLGMGLSQLLRPVEDVLSANARAMEELIASTEPEVVVVGNSLVRKGIDTEILGANLADRAVRVTKVFEPGTWPANWYTYLKNRLYGQGVEPHAVIICMVPKTLFQTELRSELARRSLVDHATSYEPLIYRKVYDQETPSPWLHRLRYHRGAFQQTIQDALRAWPVGLFAPPGGGTLAERGEAIAAPALDKIFGGEDAVDMSLHHRVIPVVEHQKQITAASEGSAVARSFVPDFLDIAAIHDSRLVFVRMPMASSLQGSVGVSPQVEAEFARLLNHRGAAYLDLSGTGFTDDLFMDAAHLNEKGRKRFSALLARELRSLDLMAEGPFQANQVPLYLEPKSSRSGGSAVLAELTLKPDPDGRPCRWVAYHKDQFLLSDVAMTSAGVGPVSPLVVLEDGRALQRATWPGSIGRECSGAFVPQAGRSWISPTAAPESDQPARSYSLALSDEVPLKVDKRQAWWIHPGTELRLDFDLWPGEPGQFTLHLGLEPLLGDPEGTQVGLDGRTISLQRDGRWLRGELESQTPTGPWYVTIRSPQDGPHLHLRWLGIEATEGSVDVIGEAALMAPPLATFLVTKQQSRAEALTTPARYTIELERVNQKGCARAAIPTLSELTDAHIQTRVPCRRCSPLRMAEDGILMDQPLLSCMPVRGGRPHRSCHEGDYFIFTASDASDPLENGHSYSLGLNPERLVGKLWWLYPGDTARLPLVNAQLRLLRDGASALTIEGNGFAGQPGSELQLRLLVDGTPVLNQSVPLARFGQGPLTLHFEHTETAGKLTVLELESDPDAPFLLLTRAELGTR